MDRKSKILLAVVILLSVFSVGATFYRAYISHNYLTALEVPCSPSTEADCFEVISEEGTSTYFKILEAEASDLIKLCGKNVGTCNATCEQIGENKCTYVFCNSTNAERYGVCAQTVETTSDVIEETQLASSTPEQLISTSTVSATTSKKVN